MASLSSIEPQKPFGFLARLNGICRHWNGKGQYSASEQVIDSPRRRLPIPLRLHADSNNLWFHSEILRSVEHHLGCGVCWGLSQVKQATVGGGVRPFEAH